MKTPEENNLVWQEQKVTYEDRCRVMGQKGGVFWLTGLSGSGKSTIAIECERQLNAMGRKVYLLDGDNIRCGINADLGFADADRRENIRRITHIAKLFGDAGIITLVSFITPFEEMREQARALIGGQFQEVYVKASFATCCQRDPKGLYQRQIANFTGKDSCYEVPEHPDLTLDTEATSPAECAARLMALILQRCGLDESNSKQTCSETLKYL